MPIPHVSKPHEQLERERAALAEAARLGIIQKHERLKYPLDTEFEAAVVGGPTGLLDPVTLRPTTPAEWIEAAKRRGKVPYIPNL